MRAIIRGRVLRALVAGKARSYRQESVGDEQSDGHRQHRDDDVSDRYLEDVTALEFIE